MYSIHQKRCSKCRETKPTTEFYHNRSQPCGLHNQCKQCGKANSRKYRKSNLARHKKFYRDHPDYFRNWKLKKEYGITLEEYCDLFNKQGGKCAICGFVPLKGSRLMPVDHDHKTGRVRGILCHKCNYAIGFFEDSVERLISAIEYLK